MRYILLLILAIFTTAVGAAVFKPESGGGISPLEYMGIVFSPGLLAVAVTILFERYQHSFELDDIKEHRIKMGKSRRYWFWHTVIVGAVFGVICQSGLQGVVNYLTGMPIMWGLVGIAAFVTGIASMGGYEALRMVLAWRIKKGKTK